MNLKNLIENLEANGMPYYVKDGDNEDVVQIGVPTCKGDVYYWFSFYKLDGEEVTGEEYVIFQQRYNRNLGTSLRSVKTRRRFEDNLRERNVSRYKQDGNFGIVFYRSNGLIGNGTNPFIN